MATARFENGVCTVSGDTTEVPPNSALTINVDGRVIHGGTVSGDFTYRAAFPLPADFVGTIEVRLAHKSDPKLLAAIHVGQEPLSEEAPEQEPIAVKRPRRKKEA